jgi:phospholipid/cholesterol/gamma-HCH transport system permease protein
MKRGSDALTWREVFAFFGQLYLLFLESLGSLFRGKVSYRQTMAQMAEVGVGSLLIACVTVGFSGAVTALYVSVQLVKYGQPGLVGGLVGQSLALEIAPVIAAIVVAARSGSAMAAELGSMVVTEQVDALRTLAVPPVRYLVAPRLLALLLMLPVVTVLANGAGILGGYFTATANGITAATFWNSLQSMTSVSNQVQGLIKCIPFAIIIAMICCRQGLFTKGGARGVGRATTSAVVLSMAFIYVTDYFLSIVLQNWGR